MLTIANRFSAQMNKLIATVDMIKAAFDLSGQDIKRFRSKHSIAVAARDIHREAANADSTVSFDGAFLVACAQFEYTFKNLMEWYIGELEAKIQAYNQLPGRIQEWHKEGSAHILSNMTNVEFKHLQAENIIANLASYQNPNDRRQYALTPEAFSYSPRNLRPGIVQDIMAKRLGINNIWQKLSRNANIQQYLGSTVKRIVERLLQSTLDGFIERRNQIIHRGRNYYTASETDVKNCSEFFSVLVQGLADFLSNCVRTI
jgi:predicted transcriptional regulator